MCEGNRPHDNCEEAGHDCSQCADSDGKGGCVHGSPGGVASPKSIEEYLNLTYKQNQVIAVKLEAYAKDLRRAGKDEIADQLMSAIPQFEKGNMYIGLAKSMLQ